MSSPEDLFLQYEGNIVPRSFNGGFVALSYIISLIGAASTLELINRRTSRNGLSNHVILVSAAVTMGGISIWCMHFIGNRAIDLAHGEAELQIVYSSGFTALSFFMPILVLLTAFVAVGTNNKVSWWRIALGGTIAGGAICGMHYLGNASIDNYSCIYNTVNIVGAALIAVAASIVALSLFFVFRASWTNSWWKRGLSAVVLAGAVSGMHWCASTGTHYRLIRLNFGQNQLTRNTTFVVVICLSVAAALIMAGVAMYSTHVRRHYAHKAQQVVLAAAVFDQHGRILVNPDGLLPCEKITDTYIEKTPSDLFNIAHPLFHWMFQASRNWNGLTSIINGMGNHLAHLPRSGRDAKVRLIDENGQLIENYDIIFRELFCLAAVNLADRMKEHISNVGTLWDEILPTGAGGSFRRTDDLTQRNRRSTQILGPEEDDFAEKGEVWKAKQQEYGRGSLMFLVRRLEITRNVERLEAAGFRFADINQVCGIIGSSMQIKTRNLGGKLNDMARYAEENNMMEPGVHLGFFGVRARVGAGFDILVRREARNLIPSLQMPLERLELWQIDFLRQLDHVDVPSLCQKLEATKKQSPREMLFASQLYDTVEALRAWIDNPIIDEAVLTAKVVRVPCRARAGTSSATTCTLITLHMVIPIHVNMQSPKCDFIPLSFFKVHQLVYKNSPQHAAFSRSVHRDIAPIVNAVPLSVPTLGHDSTRNSFRSTRLEAGAFNHAFKRWSRPSTATYSVDEDGNPIPTEFGHKSSTGSNHSSSTLKLWNGSRSEPRSPTHESTSSRFIAAHPQSSFGGIMVSQEIQVEVQEADENQSQCGAPSALNRLSTQGKPGVDRLTVVTTERRKTQLPGAVIEMKSMPEGREEIHSGPTLGSAVVESEKFVDVTTFVDELFTVCVDGR
ncbi:uncharacterized protein BCR38DRAFT_392843 [Pseudomassariella vexata]|uniref:MHYT domain-containing protein n=1 Tax=Pseudomassariella vexata TaxID=1141098 RepID=A0A1Y2DY65_9PEZI|nr:uncharacterized protein BCR38DRAFT_392843 [Pseudomassariella vexata]ORY64242.1 hypothetical protein BCR38DRAFT_392843 [Pseudomassariella vexata]